MAQNGKGKEHRRFMRLPVSVRVAYKPLGEIIDTAGLKASKVKNLSPGGLLFRSALRPKKGATIQLKFSLAGRTSRAEIPAIAQVVHCSKDGDGYDIGVQFEEILPGDLAALQKFVERNAGKKAGQ